MFFTNSATNLTVEENGEECDTIFYQGMGCSQTQALKYVGDQKIEATTGEMMWCTGRNNLPPLKVIYNLHIGSEIQDVNLNPFKRITSRFNPIKIINSRFTYFVNRSNGVHFASNNKSNLYSVTYHTTNFSKFSLGQETDIESHRRKYDSWLQKENRSKSLILYGVSRGTIATFCAFAKEKYREVKLVILEGALDSVPEVLPKAIASILKKDSISNRLHKAVNIGLTFFEKCHLIKYRSDGPSPINSVNEFPEGVPVVFITSKADTVVPARNTESLAQALVNRGKNDIYLLKLERSSHPNYMFDDAEDRNLYETFLHAIYRKYNLKHNPVLAAKGKSLLKKCTLNDIKPKKTGHFLRLIRSG